MLILINKEVSIQTLRMIVMLNIFLLIHLNYQIPTNHIDLVINFNLIDRNILFTNFNVMYKL